MKENNNMSDIRVGTGFDVHKFKKEKLKLFGITIPFNKNLDGHSDADVGFHSVADAILGGLCQGDMEITFLQLISGKINNRFSL